MKLIKGAIYDYKGEAVRLRGSVGAVSVLTRRKKGSFLGRTDLVRKAKKEQVEKYLA